MRLSAFILALLLAYPAVATAQDLSGKWQWIEVSAASRWFIRQGEAEVTFSGGRIVAHLHDGESPNIVDFELTGTLTKTNAGLRADAASQGTVAAKVTRMASDMTPGAPYRGTYIRMERKGQDRAAFGQASEYIVLSDGFNSLSLKRDIP